MSSDVRSSLPHHVFDAKVCRRLVSTSCSYRGVRPAPALNVIRSWSGVTDWAIVVAAGYNDGAIGSAVDAVVAEARRQGVPHVVWLTYRAAGNNAGIYRSHNSVLWQKASQYPELTIADWASYSAGRSSWVAADGLHLTGSGARAMADLIRVALRRSTAPGRRRSSQVPMPASPWRCRRRRGDRQPDAGRSTCPRPRGAHVERGARVRQRLERELRAGHRRPESRCGADRVGRCGCAIATPTSPGSTSWPITWRRSRRTPTLQRARTGSLTVASTPARPAFAALPAATSASP
ncbi:MAG: hypothetical protein R2697_15855 [Ilumatobacteraceae bacterium]